MHDHIQATELVKGTENEKTGVNSADQYFKSHLLAQNIFHTFILSIDTIVFYSEIKSMAKNNFTSCAANIPSKIQSYT